jgi:hypothetical protein
MLNTLFHHSMNALPLNKRIDKVLERYDCFGPITCLCLKMTPDQVEAHISDLGSEITKASPDTFKVYFSNTSYNGSSHKLSLLWRKRGSQLGHFCYIVELILAEVEQNIICRLQEFSNDQLLELWNSFSRFGDA